MNILGREFITEKTPEGWMICERWLDGVLTVIDDCIGDRRQAYCKLQILNKRVVEEWQHSKVTPEQYWQTRTPYTLRQFIVD